MTSSADAAVTTLDASEFEARCLELLDEPTENNHSGEPFWTANGFVPVEYGLERHIDERIAWAGGGERAANAPVP